VSPRTGRRPGDVDTRAEILAAARQLFTANGFDATSLRAVAREAGVDPALVHHYFDGKAHLFREALQIPIDPDQMLERVLNGPRDELGERLARLFVEVWAGPAQPQLTAILRSAMTNDHAARMLREFMTATLLKGVASTLDLPDAELRAALCAAHIVGLATMRHIIGFTPLTAAADDEIVAWLGPTLQRYLTGPLPDEPDGR
jgi:AcrR family transcriptional regulator